MTAVTRPWTLALATAALLAGCSDDGTPRQEGDSASATDDDDAAGTTGDMFPSSGITAESTSPTSTSSTTDDSGSSSGAPPDAKMGTSSTSDEPGTASSSESGDTDGSSTGSSTGEGSSSSTSSEVADTCFDIQLGIIPAKTAVTVPGLVVTGIAPSGNAFFAQHPEGGQHSGCYIFVGATDIGGLALGDEVTVEGVTEEFFDLTEINAADGMITETGSGVAVAVAEVDLADFSSAVTAEPWESVLVEVSEPQSLIVVSEPGGSEFVLTDTLDSLVVDNYLFSVYNAPGDFPSFGVGSSFEGVTGVVNYNSSAFKIAPRSASDFAGYVQ